MFQPLVAHHQGTHNYTNNCLTFSFPACNRTAENFIQFHTPPLMDHFYAVLKKNAVISANILCPNFSIFNNQIYVFTYAFLMLSNLLKMNKIDRKMSELRQIVCKITF